ncbi:methyltransferase [Streptomyces sp. PRh5]|nr:methyltransferase [Streptomyces sp. PRh5]
MVTMEYGRYGREVFGPHQQGEWARLQALAAAYDPSSFRRLTALGVRPGWRCLDAGAGCGTVSRWLADQVGAQGEVVACDLHTRFLREGDCTRLTVVECDLAAPPSLGMFDLVHVRFTLSHMRNRDAVLSSLVSLVRPGGRLVISDGADVATPLSPNRAFSTAMLAQWNYLYQSIGSEKLYGLSCPDLMKQRGLEDVNLSLDVPPLAPGTVMTSFWKRTFQQTVPAMVAEGYLREETAVVAQEYLDSPDLCDLSVGMATTCGRVPPDGL